MTPTNNLKAFPKLYASESDYVHKTFEDYLAAAEENYDKGFEPLQTLPASWYNSLLYLLTEQAQATKVLCDSIFAELQSVLTAGGVEPSASYTNQLLTAIETITKLNTATASVLGGIKSSADNWKIQVDPTTSIASVNTVDASTSTKGIVQLNDNINSDSTTQAATANAVRQAVVAAKPGIATASTAGIIKASSDNWGVVVNPSTGLARVSIVLASTTDIGIVQLNDNINSDSTTQAATANAVKKAVETAKPSIATAGTAGVIKSSASNWCVGVDASSGMAFVNTVDASTSAKGIVQLSNAIDSPESDKAATASAVNRAFMNGVYRGYCNTQSNTPAKRVDAPSNFILRTNTLIAVFFYYLNSAANPTLEVGSTGAYPILMGNKTPAGGNYYTWQGGDVVLFLFDGEFWRMLKGSSIALVDNTLYIEH